MFALNGRKCKGTSLRLARQPYLATTHADSGQGRTNGVLFCTIHDSTRCPNRERDSLVPLISDRSALRPGNSTTVGVLLRVNGVRVSVFQCSLNDH